MKIKQSIMICFGIALVLMTVGSASAATLTVNNSTGPVADFTSIQDAVDAAIDGNTILVYPGFYEENVFVNNDLTIIAASEPDVTTVQCRPGVDGYVFNLISCRKVTIAGFNVVDGKGIRFDSSNGELRNNIISSGIVFGDSGGELRNNIISGGVTTSSGGDFIIISNTIISKGIELSTDASGILENNEVYSCSGDGIYIRSQADITVFNNTVYDNIVGIVIDDFGDGRIYNNTIYGNENYGIQLTRNSYGKVANNTIYGNGEVGIRIIDDSRVDAYNNYFNNTINVQAEEPETADIEPSTWNIDKTAGTNIVGGPYIGGNYWAKPDGTGFSQTHGGVGGICDSPYIIDANNTDYLPLYLPTPIEKTENLKDYVNGLEGVDNGTKASLNAKLDNALHHLEKGDGDKAIEKLENFIDFVEIMKRQDKLGDEQAEYLINEAESIIELIQNSEG